MLKFSHRISPQQLRLFPLRKKMSSKSFERERRIAIEAVELACKSSIKIQSLLCTEETINKKDRSPVTLADFAAQALVVRAISREFPDDPIIGEESAKQLQKNPQLLEKLQEYISEFWPNASTTELIETINKGSSKKDIDSKRWWTLDPIDGTLGFLRKGQYAVALALMEGTQPVLGVLGCPSLPHSMSDLDGPKGCIFHAVRGEGSYFRGLSDDESKAKKIHVSQVKDGQHAKLTESFESSHSSHEVADQISSHLGIKNEPIKIDSQCKYGLVARGDAEIYFRMTNKEYVEKVWDHAAGIIVVEEAGGVVCDLKGRKIILSYQGLVENYGVVVTNQFLHKPIMEAIETVVNKS
eukprot:TRINITY_DN7494_c0_g1_i1.p1 TRINITY_DN7494_c0_g1~~TRINITY_DN7494_c0_g1_i1.p1  ORF type:complete len:354 (-),score=85.08 TRINITY_DN7494_c0_g1_i1:51-1112(-)